ncbi:MAG: glyoxylate/hydroxypyruvate reductase A [Burkholderiales bacterium]|nr:glyoxylate/hydroxypyruvate reductase A [Burkholderiales bacterium]
MNLVLLGSWDDDERDAWAAALQAELPGHRLWWPGQAPLDPATVAAAIVANPPPGSLQGWPGLRLIQSLWAGVDRLLGDATVPADVPVARMVDPAMNRAMAETALWAVLSLHRHTFRYARQQHLHRWHVWPQRRADEVAVLVLGQGQMGHAVAQRLHEQGYRVSAWRRTPSVPAATRAAVGPAPWPVHSGPVALRVALARAELLVNLLPLTPETRGLLDARCFCAMPRGAAVVNLARGAHVVDADLLAALDSGAIGHAVLDVFSTEPLPPEHRYWSHPQVTVLPHAAAQTDLRSAARLAARNLHALAAGQPLQHLVDRQRGY